MKTAISVCMLLAFILMTGCATQQSKCPGSPAGTTERRSGIFPLCLQGDYYQIAMYN